jgi:hypothetical protein
MYTYRKQVSPNSTTAASTTNFVIYELDLNGIATNKMADVEVIASLSTANDPNNISTIYYRKLQLVASTLSPNYSYPPKNSSFNYNLNTSDLYLSEISYVQSGSGASNGNIQIKTTNPTGTSRTGTCFVHFKINFY